MQFTGQMVVGEIYILLKIWSGPEGNLGDDSLFDASGGVSITSQVKGGKSGECQGRDQGVFSLMININENTKNDQGRRDSQARPKNAHHTDTGESAQWNTRHFCRAPTAQTPPPPSHGH